MAERTFKKCYLGLHNIGKFCHFVFLGYQKNPEIKSMQPVHWVDTVCNLVDIVKYEVCTFLYQTAKKLYL